MQTVISDITAHKQAEATLKEFAKELRSLASHLQTVREEERAAIAREIHDQFSQVLVALNLDLSVIKSEMGRIKDFPPKTEIISRLGSTKLEVSKLLQGVSELVQQLHPRILEELGLISALETLIAELERHAAHTIHIEPKLTEVNLDSERAFAVYRIAQEAFTNIARHSKAKKVIIELRKKGACIHLMITDDGIGFSKENVNRQKSFGLLSMRERSIVIGGSLEISSQKNKGTSIHLTIPSQVQK